MNSLIRKFVSLLVFFFVVIEFNSLSSFFLFGVREKSVSFAQTLSPERVSEAVYEQMPNLPKENDYFSQETGERAIDNDLISRMVRYHQYIKARPTRFRLDWKLTIADYFGINEQMKEDRYPGDSTLQENPLRKDQETIRNLSMQERQKLVDVLVSIFAPSVPNQTEGRSPSTENQPESTPETEEEENKFRLPRQGGAELLLP